MELHLSSSTSVDGKIELVETRRNRSTGEESTQMLQLDIDTAIDVTAKGGCGGRGGVGGNGGNGERGSAGRVSFNAAIATIPCCLVILTHVHTLHFSERFTIQLW